MRKSIVILDIVSILLLIIGSNTITLGDWAPGDDHKMHEPQLPDSTRWDICLVHQRLADDFMCIETGLITDIYFWVSWRGDKADFSRTNWMIEIYDDSDGQPGRALWTWTEGDGNASWKLYGSGNQGWHCPEEGITDDDDHVNYYQVNITGITSAFRQTEGETYWLCIGADISEGDALVGWKSSRTAFANNTVFLNSQQEWEAIGGNAVGLSFVISREYAIEIDVMDFVIGEIELTTPLGREMVEVNGTATQKVFFEGALEGMADDNDGDSLEEVELELTELLLTGVSQIYGPVQLCLDPNVVSTGVIEEKVNNTPGVLDVPPFTASGLANVYFDVHIEVDVGGVLFNKDFFSRFSCQIVHKPWEEAPHLFSNHSHTPLYDADGNETRSFFAIGTHWTGAYTEVDVFDASLVRLEILTPRGPEQIRLGGLSSMYVFFDGVEEGIAGDGDGDGLDEIKTEMLALSLTGSNPTLGLVQMNLRSDELSKGEIEETINYTPGLLDLPPFGTGTAQSFFDVFFELEIEGRRLHADKPLRWSGEITHKPAASGDFYESSKILPLLDEHGQPSDYSIEQSRYEPGVCGDAAHPYPVMDFNMDCIVDFLDFAIFCQHWLECTKAVCY
jgi:hypothetical protein